MTKTEILQAIAAAPKGANIMVDWERPLKMRKAYKNMPMTKFTSMLCRIAVDYDNTKPTIEGRANGSLPAVNAGLNGMQWETFPTLLKSIKSGKLHIRLQTGTFKNVETKKEYRLNGQKIEKEDYAHAMCKEPKSNGKFGPFNVPIENIIRIHKYVGEAVEEAETI